MIAAAGPAGRRRTSHRRRRSRRADPGRARSSSRDCGRCSDTVRRQCPFASRRRRRPDALPKVPKRLSRTVGCRSLCRFTGARPAVRVESEPVEVVEQRRLECRPAADAIVILDAQQHAPVQRAGDPPDVNRVHDVPEVQVPCRGGRIARDRRATQSRRKRGEIGTRTVMNRLGCDRVNDATFS